MCQPTDKKLQALLKKIAMLDSELEDILCNKNNIDSVRFEKIDTYLYRTTHYKNDIHLGWNGTNKCKDKIIVFYIDGNPVSILLFLEKNILNLWKLSLLTGQGKYAVKKKLIVWILLLPQILSLKHTQMKMRVKYFLVKLSPMADIDERKRWKQILKRIYLY